MLTPEVQALVDSGRLHEWDAEVAARLLPENQMAWAEKCLSGNLDLPYIDVQRSLIHQGGYGGNRD